MTLYESSVRQLSFKEIGGTRCVDYGKAPNGSTAAEVVTMIVRAHPYIRNIETANIDGATPNFWEARSLRRLAAHRVSPAFLHTVAIQTAGKSAWATRDRTLGLLAEATTDQGNIVYFPMMKFNQGTPIDVIVDRFTRANYPGYLFHTGDEKVSFIGSALLPENIWRSFLAYCETNIHGVNEQFIKLSQTLATNALRLFPAQRHEPAQPRVMGIISSPS